MLKKLAIGAILVAFLGAIAYSQGTNETFTNYIRGLPLASTPLVGNEMTYIQQNGQSRQTTISAVSGQGNFASLVLPDQILSGGANNTSFPIGVVAGGTITIDCGKNPLQYLTNNGSFVLAAPVNDGSCIILTENSAAAGSITFSGFSVGANTGDPLNITPNNNFGIFVWRINGISGYRVNAYQ